MEENSMDVNTFRKWSNALAEAVDAWRIIPRLLVVAYGYLTFKTWIWYTNIETVVLKSNCQLVNEQMICDITGVAGPSTQQAALVTAVTGMAGVVIGLYSGTGRDWSKPLLKWFKRDKEENVEQ